MADSLSNRTIRGYVLGEQIGHGGTGAVYHAQQPTVEREVAIKVILPTYANHPDFIRRFDVEAKVIAQIEHPHIVPLYDYWRDADGAFLVMRWLPRSLRTTLTGGAWKLEAVARVIQQIGGALMAAHRKHIIHRDIKPDNILLDDVGNAYLADFGIAKNLAAANTSSSGLKGTLEYVSPEQIKGEAVGIQTDIYLLGLLLSELLTGQRPFKEATTTAMLLAKHLSDPLPRLSGIRSDVPRTLDAVLQKATAKKPTDRYVNVADFLTVFQQALGTNAVPHVDGVDDLTGREREIIELLAEGLSGAEIAARMVVAPGTIKWYLKQIYDKLDVHSRPQAIDRARQIVKQWATMASPASDAMPHSTANFTLVQPITGSSLLSDLLPNPYKGLRAFQEADTEDFFGRETLTKRLLKRLSENDLAQTDSISRLLVVVGPSGSGKSSVVRASLLPRLRQGALAGSDKWFVASMFPGAYPLEELESALMSVAIQPLTDMIALLRSESRGLLRVVKQILPNDEETELLLVIDQAEELFTLVEDEAERAHFLESLRIALMDPRSRLRVILTLRADFTDRPLQYAKFGEMLRQRIEFVLPLSPDELRQAIIGPAERIGVKVESPLVTSIVADVNQQPGALPLLQFALTELFEQREGRKLTLNAYHNNGGVTGTLMRRADELFDSFNAEGQAAAQQLFLRLVAFNEGNYSRRRVLKSELSTLQELAIMLDAVIEVYNQHRLLTLDRDPVTHATTVEIAHDALLRSWDRLRSWLDEATEDIRTQRQVAMAASEWIASGGESGLLISGAHLLRFEALLEDGNVLLNQDERQFVKASVAERERLRQLRETQENYVMDRGVRTVETLEQIQALWLAASAATLLPTDVVDAELAALLALRSLQLHYTANAEYALRRAIGQLTAQDHEQLELDTMNVSHLTRLACSVIRRDLTAEERDHYGIGDDSPTCNDM